MSIITRRRSQDSMKKLYDWFYLIYGMIEKSLNKSVTKVVNRAIAVIPDVKSKTAVEYACGSGLLSLKLAGLFSHVDGIDRSAGMLKRAGLRSQAAGKNITFSEGDILSIDKKADSYDWAFVSFALHLFSENQTIEILKNLLNISREGVIIIDHSKKWFPAAAFVEWLEGSYYDIFIKLPFDEIAKTIGAASFKESEIGGLSVMVFYK